MMYSTPGLRMMSWRPGSARPVVSRPHAARHAMESGLSEPFGTAMRSGRPPACCSVAAGGKRLIEVERKPGGGTALAVGPDRVVVAPARTERCAERGGEGDEHDSCVVVERAHDREVDEDAVGQALLVELLEGLLEVGEAVLQPSGATRSRTRATASRPPRTFASARMACAKTGATPAFCAPVP